jgi:hypothetical protein
LEEIMVKSGVGLAVGVLALAAAAAHAQVPDPRTPAGQLAACGGAMKWRAVGYLEFEVKITNATGAIQGPFHYRWDRRNGYLRVQGVTAAGSKVDSAIDLGSRSGGAWEDGKQLTGKKLGETVSWSLTRFGEDILWVTFPLDWGAAGVTVTALPDTPAEGGVASPTVQIVSPAGIWRVFLDPTTGRIVRTVVSRKGVAPLTVGWDKWQAVGGIYFARAHSIAETGENVEVTVLNALSEPPKGAF